jgi:hypothetical protein
MTRKSQHPVELLTVLSAADGTLAQIAEKTNFLSQISTIVRQICPDLPADAWHIVNFKQNVIIFEVKSSIWYQRLQFERMKISQALAETSQGRFSQIEIKVNPLWAKKVVNTPLKSNEPLPTITQQTAQQLKEIAEKAPESLKQSLLRLAQHIPK